MVARKFCAAARPLILSIPLTVLLFNSAIAVSTNVAALANNTALAGKEDNVQATLQFVKHPDDVETYDAIVDTRPLASCQQSSLPGAICLPVEDVLAPNRRLANWSGLLWLLGSANLTGSEHVLIVGHRADRKQFIAGLLLLAGQRRITLAGSAVSELIKPNPRPSPGATRATSRTRVYTAPMRSELIVLQSELESLIHTGVTTLDGRSEHEYYGVSIRSIRGGHIPGAIHSPLSDWIKPAWNKTSLRKTHQDDRASVSDVAEPATPADLYRTLSPVVYGHDAFDGVVYLAALRAADVQARVYLAGWVEWATNSSLAVDSASFPVARPHSQPALDRHEPESTGGFSAVIDDHLHPDNRTGLLSAMAMIVLCLLIAIFYTGRKFSGRS